MCSLTLSTCAWCSPFAVLSDGDHSDNEILSSICANELKEQEELKRRMELEAEERKLEETLEYQRKIENEAKQRQLAEKQKKLTLTQLGKATEELSDPADDDDRVKQLKLSTQASWSLSVLLMLHNHNVLCSYHEFLSSSTESLWT